MRKPLPKRPPGPPRPNRLAGGAKKLKFCTPATNAGASSNESLPVAVADFETDPFLHGRTPKAFFCGWYDGKKFDYIWSENEKTVLRWAASKVGKFPGIVYYHNGGRFDLLGYLFRGHRDELHERDALIINGRIVRVGFGSAEVRDSYAILPAPLSAHDKGEMNYKWLEKGARDIHRKEIIEYGARDCRSLFTLVTEFISIHGQKCVTAASAGMKHAQSLDYKYPSISEWQDKEFRLWYFGGRVQAFQSGVLKGKFTGWDITSAYPHAMIHPHPVGKEFEFVAAPKKIYPQDFLKFRGEARGCFPVRTKKGLDYPHTQGEFFVTGWEYLAAKRLKLIGRHKIEFARRPAMVSDFRRYVDFWFAKKEEAEAKGDKALRLIAKIMLNSLYGKFAQNPAGWKEYLFVSDKKILTPKLVKEGWEEVYVDEENHFAAWARASRRPATYYNVATAASITGFVRARLMEAISKNDRACLNCDTDSLNVVGRGKFDFVGNSLGAWKKEDESDLFACAGKKLYAKRLLSKYCQNEKEARKNRYYWDGSRAWKIASKGCHLTPEEMQTVARGEEVDFKNDAPTFSLASGTRFITRTIRKTVK